MKNQRKIRQLYEPKKTEKFAQIPFELTPTLILIIGEKLSSCLLHYDLLILKIGMKMRLWPHPFDTVFENFHVEACDVKLAYLHEVLIEPLRASLK